MTIKELRAKARETLKGRWLQIVSIFILVQLVNIAHGIFSEEWTKRIELYAETSDIIISLAVFIGVLVLLTIASYSIVINAIKFTRGEKVGISTFISDMAANIGRSIKISLAYLWYAWKWMILATIAFPMSFVILTKSTYDFSVISRVSMMGSIIISIAPLIFLIACIWAFVDALKKVYDYYLTYYLSFDYPEKSLREIFERSRELMRGYKAKAVIIPCTFIGWYLLSIIPMYIGIAIVTVITSINGVTSSIPLWGISLLELLTLVTSIVAAYMSVTLAHFYENFNPKECFNEDYIKPEEANTKNYKIILAVICASFIGLIILIGILSVVAISSLWFIG